MISSPGLRTLGAQPARPADAATAPSTVPGGFLLALALPLAIGFVWELAAARGWIEARLLPPPSIVLGILRELAASGELLRHANATLLRVVEGFGLGVAAATFLGALTGYSAFARRLLDPTLQALRNIPSIAWVPLFILWFGIFEASKVALIAVGVFFPIYLGLMTGIGDVDRKLVEVGRAYELSSLAMIRRILMPAALPAYLTGMRSGLGLGWMFVIAAELMGASEGLGYLLVDGQMTGNAAQILASLVLFAILGKATDSVLAFLLRRQLAWRDSFVRG
jgi:sulfonate transport system permease protein